MNQNDQLHFDFAFNLTPFLLNLRNEISLVRVGNQRESGVYILQRRLAVATTNIGTLCGKNFSIKDSALKLISAITFSANSRSPPLGSLRITSRMARMQLSADKLHSLKNNSGGTNG